MLCVYSNFIGWSFEIPPPEHSRSHKAYLFTHTNMNFLICKKIRSFFLHNILIFPLCREYLALCMHVCRLFRLETHFVIINHYVQSSTLFCVRPKQNSVKTYNLSFDCQIGCHGIKNISALMMLQKQENADDSSLLA